MNKIRTFWRTYWLSISDPNYYNDVLKAKFSFSLKYFILFYLVLSLASTAVFSWRDVPTFVQTADKYFDHLVANYPEDLVLDLRDNSLTVTGVDEPYSIPLPEDDTFLVERDYLLTVDTASDDFYSSGLTFYRDQATLRYFEDPIVIGYDQIALEGRLTQTSLLDTQTDIKEFIAELSWFLPLIFWLFMAVVNPIIVLGLLVLLSTMIWLATQFGKSRLTYRKSYQLGLHTITFAETVAFLQALLFVGLELPSVYTTAYFAASLLVLFNLRRGK